MMFFKKKKFVELEFSKEKLMTHFESIMDRMFQYREEEFTKDILEALQIGKNVAILDAAKAQTEQERIYRQGKIETYDEFLIQLDRSLNRLKNERTEGKKGGHGVFNAFRKVNNQAGPAL